MSTSVLSNPTGQQKSSVPPQPFSIQSSSSLAHDILSRQEVRYRNITNSSTNEGHSVVAAYRDSSGNPNAVVIIDEQLQTLSRDRDTGHWTLSPLSDSPQQPQAIAVARPPYGPQWLVTLTSTGATFLSHSAQGKASSFTEKGTFQAVRVAYTPAAPVRIPMVFLLNDKRNLISYVYNLSTGKWDRFSYDLHGELAESPTFIPIPLDHKTTEVGYLKGDRLHRVRLVDKSVHGPYQGKQDPALTRITAGFVDITGDAGFFGIQSDSQGKRRLTQYRANSWQNLGVFAEYGQSTIDDTGLLHLYLETNDGVVMVLHQTGWSGNGPIWNSVGGKPVAIPLAAGETGVPFLDPLQHGLPMLLVPFTPPDATDEHERGLRLLQQDADLGQWTDQPLQLVKDTYYEMRRWRTRLVLKDAAGAPVPRYPVTLRATSPTNVELAGKTLRIGPQDDQAATAYTNALGVITLSSQVYGLTPPAILASADGLAEGAEVQPAKKVHNYLAGIGSLPDRPGFTGNTLRNATVDGKPLVPKKTWSGSLTPDQAVAFMGNAIALADPNLPLPVKSGYLLQRDAEGVLTHREFETQEELSAAVTRIQQTAEYGGFLDDIEEIFEDVASGIVSGAAKVTNIFLNVANKSIRLMLDIGGVIIDLGEMILHSVADAMDWLIGVMDALGTIPEDFLKWLAEKLDVKAIWHTKTAIEEALTRFPPYIEGQFRSLETRIDTGIFTWARTNLSAQFDALITRAGGAVLEQAKGTPNDPVPPIAGSSGSLFGDIVEMVETAASDSANWLWDKVFGDWFDPLSAMIPEIAFPSIKSLTGPADELIASLGPLSQAFEKASEEFAQWLARELSLNDDQTSEIPLASFLEALKQFSLKLIDTIQDLVQIVFAALYQATATATNFLAAEINLGPLNAVIDWFQDYAEVPATERTSLTLGGLISLLIAFPATLAYRAWYGSESEPFPSGKLPNKEAKAPGSDEVSAGTIACFTVQSAAILLLSGVQTASDFVPASLLIPGTIIPEENQTLQVLSGVTTVLASLGAQVFLWPTHDMIPFAEEPSHGTRAEIIGTTNWALGSFLPILDLVFMAATSFTGGSKLKGGTGRIKKFVDPLGLAADTMIGVSSIVLGILECVFREVDGEDVPCPQYVFNITYPIPVAMQWMRLGIVPPPMKETLLVMKVLLSAGSGITAAVTRIMGWNPTAEVESVPPPRTTELPESVAKNSLAASD